MKVYIGNWPKNPAKERKVDIRIDKWDTWSMDNTLALIIEPMLKQLKATKNGYPCVGNDIPEGCKTCSCEKDWNIILDKMIFAFESLNNDCEDQYHSGECDLIWTPIDVKGNETPDGEWRRMDYGPNHTHKFDVEGWKAHNEKIQEGLELFGKHFRNLWD
jgi:hypothetical protein